MGLELTESEYTKLMLASTRDNVLMCLFEGGRVFLRDRPESKWAIDMLKKLRADSVTNDESHAAASTAAFVEGSWVADFCDPERPRIAQVKDAYELDGELLLDLVMYQRDGKKIGRVSPACGGPKSFEPACPAVAWEPIEEPDFDYLAAPRYQWGDRVKRLNIDRIGASND